MVWGVDEFVPKWLKYLPANQQREVVKAHIQDIGRRYAGKVTHWDVNNGTDWNLSYYVFGKVKKIKTNRDSLRNSVSIIFENKKIVNLRRNVNKNDLQLKIKPTDFMKKSQMMAVRT